LAVDRFVEGGMPDFEYYRIYLQGGGQELEPYLLSSQLFWTVNASPSLGEPGYPKLTLGGFLFFDMCARTLAKTASQVAVMHSIDADVNSFRTRWQVAWARKASWEFGSRLRQWGNVLKEIRLDPEEHSDYYRHEVRLRVFIQLLLSEIRESETAQQAQLDGLDLLLKAVFAPGDFIWEPDLTPGFPSDPYWFLWGHPKKGLD
jgi:hypothetical protein